VLPDEARHHLRLPGASERDQIAIAHRTKKIKGVECLVVDDRGYEAGKLIEKTHDWYAQDKKGNVWYFGEDSKAYERERQGGKHQGL